MPLTIVKSEPLPAVASSGLRIVKSEPLPDFQSSNAKDAAGNATVRDRMLGKSGAPVTQQEMHDLIAAGRAETGPSYARQLFDAGPGAIFRGAADVRQGKFKKGAHEMISGAGVTALPFGAVALAPAMAAAPIATALTVAGGAALGYGGTQAARAGAGALGAGTDTVDLAGDIGGIVGGVGGAVGASKLSKALSAAMSAWSVARQSARGRQGIDAFKQAIPATASAPYRPDQLSRAVPYMRAEHATRPIQTVEANIDALDSAIRSIESHIGTAVEAHPNDLIRVRPLAAVANTLKSSPRKNALALGLRELDDLGLDTPMTVQQAELVRRQLNAENKAILKRNNYDVSTARQADPGFAAREAAAQSLRDGIYDQLAARGIKGVRALRQDEGALIAVRNAAQRERFNAEKRVTGTGTQGAARRLIGDVARVIPKAGPYIADVIAKPNQTRDQLIAKAFKLMGGVPRGRTPTGSTPAPRSISQVVRDAAASGQPIKFQQAKAIVDAEKAAAAQPAATPPPAIEPTAAPSQPVTAPAVAPVAGAKPVPAAKPARVRVVKKPEAAPAPAPEVAAAKVVDQIKKTIDVKGVTSAAEVQRRVVSALSDELPAAQKAAGFKELEVVDRGKRYGGSVVMDGRVVASVDQYGRIAPVDFPGVTGSTDTRGRTTFATDAGKLITNDELFGSNPDSRSLTPAENRTQALHRVSAALSRVKGAGKLTVDIPGDGTFTIERNPHAIQSLIKRITSGGSSPWKGLGAQGKAGPPKPPRYWKTTW